MKSISQLINESKYSLCSEVQNEVGKEGEYHTYDYSDGQKKFKKGFININIDNDFFAIQGFNSAKEYENFVGVEEGMYEELEDLDVGDSTEIDGSEIIRIW